MIKNYLKLLGPGLLFAGAAIGVSHLVQSTRAGADYGWGLLWALILVNLFKYPFFQFGPRYALATNKSLLEGYHKLGKIYLWIYFLINIATMFTIQTAVTIVTASLAANVFGVSENLVIWSLIITFLCFIFKNSIYFFSNSLILSTGTFLSKFFEPARKLFWSCGFEECDPFGHYKNDPNSCYMKIKV